MNEDNFSITAEEFVNEFVGLKQSLLDGYFCEQSDLSRINRLVDAGLNSTQIDVIKDIFDDALTDSFYTILLALEGCASINNHQISYKIQDEEGNELTGELDGLAYEAFHEKQKVE